MIVRAIDVNHDWLFGKGRNDYKSDLAAVAQSIDTRLNCFLGDCFFATNFGIDWFNLLGNKDLETLNLAISTVILNTQNVVKLNQLSSVLDSSRNLTVRYEVTATSGVPVQGELSFFNPEALLTEAGQPLTTEDGDVLIL